MRDLYYLERRGQDQGLICVAVVLQAAGQDPTEGPDLVLERRPRGCLDNPRQQLHPLVVAWEALVEQVHPHVQDVGGHLKGFTGLVDPATPDAGPQSTDGVDCDGSEAARDDACWPIAKHELSDDR